MTDGVRTEKVLTIDEYVKDLFESCEHEQQLEHWERKVKAIIEYYAATRF